MRAPFTKIHKSHTQLSNYNVDVCYPTNPLAPLDVAIRTYGFIWYIVITGLYNCRLLLQFLRHRLETCMLCSRDQNKNRREFGSLARNSWGTVEAQLGQKIENSRAQLGHSWSTVGAQNIFTNCGRNFLILNSLHVTLIKPPYYYPSL